MSFALSKKPALEVLEKLGSNDQMLDMLDASKEQLVIFNEAVNKGPPRNIPGEDFEHAKRAYKQDQKDQEKFSIAVSKIQEKVNRHSEFTVKKSSYLNFQILSSTTKDEIIALTQKLDEALEHASDPKEILFLETLKESAGVFREKLSSDGHCPTIDVPILEREVLFLPMELKVPLIQETLNNNKKIPPKEKAILQDLCANLTKDCEIYGIDKDKEAYSSRVDEHINAAINQAAGIRLSQGWSGFVNSICEILGKPPYYTELASKDMDSIKKEFHEFKSSLISFKEDLAKKELEPEPAPDKGIDEGNTPNLN